jgi:hypothetical protein
MKRVAILQSNYIPWKGYFDIIAAVDEFVLYDDVQYTSRDWRNRNRIKTQAGPQWLTVPVGSGTRRRIRDVELPSDRWQRQHWNALMASYGRARYFREVAALFEPIYLAEHHATLSALNRRLIETVCGYLEIGTAIRNSWDYPQGEGRTGRLVEICAHAGADEYLSGPAARAYLDEAAFAARGIRVSWMDYSGYPEYPQLWGDFVGEVTVLDLLFNCGADSRRYMKQTP